jgi:phosphoglycolate phosphatase
LACRQLDRDTERTVYIGDNIRDIEAAKNADVIAIAAAYGYLPANTKIEEWHADFILRSAEQTEPLLNTLKFT